MMKPGAALRMVAQEVAAAVRAVDPEQVAALVEAIVGARAVFVTGQGRSGFAARAFAMRLAQLGLQAHFVGEPTAGPVQAGDLLVVASGSGETATSLAAACTAQQAGAEVALLTSRPQSSIGSLTSVVVEIPAPSVKTGRPPGRSLQPLSSLFEQAMLVICDVVILLAMQRLGETPESMFARHTNLE